MKKDKWVVCVKGGPSKWSGYEIALVKKSDEHSKQSYGWFGSNKIHVSSADNHDGKIDKELFRRLKGLAKEYAEGLNNGTWGVEK